MKVPATARDRLPLQGEDEDVALRSILEGTATETGKRFFNALVESLARALNTCGAWVTEYLEDSRRLRSLAFWMNGRWIEEYEYDVEGTPCEVVIADKRIVHYPENIVALFPRDPDLPKLQAVSYMGAPLLSPEGTILGNLAVLDTRPLPQRPRYQALIRIFAARAAAEAQRLRAESELQRREEELARLVESAMDGIIQLDGDLRVLRVNSAAERTYRLRAADLVGRSFTDFLSQEGSRRLRSLAAELESAEADRNRLWIPGGLDSIRGDGDPFPAETTLSRFEMNGSAYYTLILRDVNDRTEAERRIRSLTLETEYLREEFDVLGQVADLVGRSRPFIQVLEDIRQVAVTDSTVLLCGETGTGKGVVARAIHAASLRRDRPLVKVNCAAIPASLIESELFGHEKGAFTGAAERREGRFSLADGGSIFLDEIGELPLELQPKLLRILQDGEFEPVGSSTTRRVDVRVIAATNRDLQRAIRDGQFREDLYYRLDVFPIHLPPLRERGDDVVLLAEAVARKLARKMGRRIEPLSCACIRRLKSYGWPGNIRELENVIERAMITSRDGCLDLERALPESGPASSAEAPPAEPGPGARILTSGEIEDLERSNITRALETAGWKVSGERGAARLLGMNPSTLSSRLRSLGIRRPRS
ncbi:MAG: sigma 54-interacting transcriptional regulator [Planctomycetes bacterium]|nr:sigma 54-interacting transcriptional regulator [Planctomycetota bacterium]